MVGVGSREAAGGAPADAYRPYEGMTGSELDDIDLLFNHAEVCIEYCWFPKLIGFSLQDTTIILETARAIHPNLVKNFLDAGQNADRLGKIGCNIYHCKNYTAPQHQDSGDAARGLCTQLEWRACTSWMEYGFIHAEDGYAFETQENMLW